MKKLLLATILISGLTFAQTNNTLTEFGIFNIKMGETKTEKSGIITIENAIFKSVEFDTDENKSVNKIVLKFKNDKAMKSSKSFLLGALQNNFGEAYGAFSGTSMFRRNLEKAIVNIDSYDGVKYSDIYFFKYDPVVNENTDEFTHVKYFNIDSNGYDEVYLTGKYVDNERYYQFKFKGVEDKGVKKIFMLILTKSEDWKFIDRIIFLNDGESFEIKASSEREVMRDGKTSEVLAVELPEALIKKILESSSHKLRISGKGNDDLVLTPFVIETLRRLNDFMYK